MAGGGGGRGQKLGGVINLDAMHPALEGTKQMVVKVRYFDGLVNTQQMASPNIWVMVPKYSGHGAVSLGPQGWVICLHGNRSHVVMSDQGMAPHNARVSIVVKFKSREARGFIYTINLPHVTGS